MAAPTSETDVILNRINVSLARSQRLINSWLPPKPESEAVDEKEDEDDFKSMTEIGGLGSKTAYAEEEGLPDGAFQRKKLSSNDKLLEQLLGKKVAQARKKEAGKSMSTSKHAAPKQLASWPKVSKGAESEDEDEGGRVAAFKSKKRKPEAKPQTVKVSTDDETMEDVIDSGEATGTPNPTDNDAAVEKGSPPQQQKAAKRKSTSYLDELLAQKANKKSKKKKKKKKQSQDAPS